MYVEEFIYKNKKNRTNIRTCCTNKFTKPFIFICLCTRSCLDEPIARKYEFEYQMVT